MELKKTWKQNSPICLSIRECDSEKAEVMIHNESENRIEIVDTKERLARVRTKRGRKEEKKSSKGGKGGAERRKRFSLLYVSIVKSGGLVG